VVTLLNNRMVTPDDFVSEVRAYRLKEERRKVLFTKLEERLNEEVTHPIFGYKASYQRCIELQARLLAKCVTGELEEEAKR
jgi:CRISP-associated protein Cas1